MNFINITKRISYKGLAYLFSYYDADNVDVPDLNICAECEAGRQLLADDDFQEEITQYCIDNYVNVKK